MCKGNCSILVCVIAFAVPGLYGPSSVTRADIPTEGLVAYWAFNEGEGDTAFDSAGDNHGTIYGAQWTDGWIIEALNFNGAHDYVAVGPGVLPEGEKSFFAWIKIPPVGQSSSSDHDFIIYTASTDATTVWFYFNNGVEIRCLNNSSGGFDVHYTAAIDDNQWHFIGFTYDNTNTLHLYLNGTEVEASTGNDYSTTTIQEAIGGHAQDINNRSWLGKIDEVAIYSRALSIEEVEQLYQAGLGQLAELEIVGPSQIAENFEAKYKAIAHFDNGRTEDVTISTEWAVDNEQIATINDDGLLQTGPTAFPQDVTIYAEYSEDDITVAAEKMVSVPSICLEGSALDFNGAHDYVEVGPSVLPMGNKSLFAWIKMPPVGESPKSDHDFIIYTASTDATTVWFYFNNGVEIRCLNNSSGGFDVHYTAAIDDDQWHFVGFTYDNTNTLHLYLDGTEVAASTGNDYSTTTIQEAIGGHAQDINNRSWLGKIDEVRIYDMALSQEEVWDSMHTKPSGSEPGLVAYWSFDEGEGQIAYDIAGGHDGYLGSDPCGPDNADPVWIESDAPAGICSERDILNRTISTAIEIKQSVLEQLDDALKNERAAEEILQDMQRNRDITELSFRQILLARIKIVWAIIKEMWSERKLTQSKEHLEDSLDIITQETDSGSNGPVKRQIRTR